MPVELDPARMLTEGDAQLATELLLFVPRPQGGAPFAVPIARDFDFPRPATDRTVLYESLPASSTLIDVQLHVLAAVGTTEW